MRFKKTLIKNYFKSISSNKKSFYLIILIAFITSSIYISLLSTPYTFKENIEKYYNNTNSSDIKISSKIGFNKADEVILRSINDINGVMFSKSLDAKVNINNKIYKIKVNSINENSNEEDPNYINKLILTSGKYPKTINEGLVEENFLKEQKLSLGDLISLEDLNNNSLKAKKIKIVGTVKNSFYSIFEKESINNKLRTNDYYIYLKERNFYSNNYNEIFITLKDSNKKDIFSKSYKKYINKNKEKINEVLSKVIKDNHQNKINLLNNDISFINDELNRLYNLDLPQESLNELIKQLSSEADKKNKELANLKENNFSIISKDETSGFIKYKTEIENMKVISKKFSILSLVLGISINLFIMIKLILKDKKQIDILYTMGYNKLNISFKYIIFIILANILGFILSLPTSFILTNIINLYLDFIYQIPISITYFKLNFAVFSFCFTTLFNLIIVLFILCFIFKENLFSFINKKLNIILAIILSLNIALIFGVLGIKFSINNLINNQFSNIYKYDATIKIKDDYDIKILQDNLFKDKLIKDSLGFNKSNVTVNDTSATLIVPSNSKKLNNFILSENKDGNKINLNDKGIIITKKISESLNLNKNDKIKIILDNKNEQELKIINITENYIDNNIYMSYKLYKSLYNEDVIFDNLLVKNKPSKKTNKDILQLEINNYNEIEEYIKKDNIKNGYIKTISSLNFICNLLVIIHFLLFMIILYNLTLQNPRKKDISILKNIGFNNIQILLFCIKQNFILIFPPVIGIILGSLCANTIVKSIFINEFIIPFNVKIIHFFLIISCSYLLTFTALYFKIRKINNIDIKKQNNFL